MVIDPDHLSVLARQQLLDVVERRGYSGVVSSHSWSTPDAIPRILRLGGVVTPMAGSTTDFAAAWRETKQQRDPRFYWGIGWGADMNGFASQGGPRAGGNVSYPFRSFDGLTRRPPAQRPARLRHQRRRGGPLRAVPRLGRGPAAARRPGGRRRPRPRRRGVPADVGARRRRAGDALRSVAPGRRAAASGACGCGRGRRRCCAAPASRAGGPAGPGSGAASPRTSTAAAASCPCGAPRRATARSARGRASALSAATRRRTRRVAPGVRGRGRDPHRRAARRVRWVGATTAR